MGGVYQRSRRGSIAAMFRGALLLCLTAWACIQLPWCRCPEGGVDHIEVAAVEHACSHGTHPHPSPPPAQKDHHHEHVQFVAVKTAAPLLLPTAFLAPVAWRPFVALGPRTPSRAAVAPARAPMRPVLFTVLLL